jgi:hypothetical protein
MWSILLPWSSARIPALVLHLCAMLKSFRTVVLVILFVMVFRTCSIPEMLYFIIGVVCSLAKCLAFPFPNSGHNADTEHCTLAYKIVRKGP